jgi:hypothetical protein
MSGGVYSNKRRFTTEGTEALRKQGREKQLTGEAQRTPAKNTETNLPQGLKPHFF